MKYLLLVLSLSFSLRSWAVAECSGQTLDGTWVLLHVTTSGATGVPEAGAVTIEREGNKFGYRFTREDITQFFEYDEASNGSAMVGVAAYVNKEAPVSAKYVGLNFVDMDLKTVIMEGKVNGIKGNFLRVWKGPGHASNDQFQFTKVACAVWSNI